MLYFIFLDLPFNAQTLEEPIPQSNLQYNDVPPPNSNAKVDTKKRPQEQSFDEVMSIITAIVNRLHSWLFIVLIKLNSESSHSIR